MAEKKSPTKKLQKILGILLVAIVVLGIVAKTAEWIDGGPAEKTVETETVERRTITQIVSASGHIQPETGLLSVLMYPAKLSNWP